MSSGAWTRMGFVSAPLPHPVCLLCYDCLADIMMKRSESEEGEDDAKQQQACLDRPGYESKD